MATRRARLGDGDLELSTLVFGSMGRSRSSDPERIRVVHAAIDAGITSIDTAPLYDFGGVESLLGRALADRRDRVELLSKVGLRWDDEHGEVLFAAPTPDGPRVVRRDGRPSAIRRDVEESLARLRTDHLDLCQIHHPDRRLPIEESLGELERLRDEGKIRHIGVSNFEAHEFQLARGRPPAPGGGPGVVAHQLHYSLIERHAEAALVSAAQAAGVGLLAYSPLEAGALTDRALDPTWTRGREAIDPLFHPKNLRPIQDALRGLVAPLAKAHGVPISAICLAWLLERPGVTGAIVGASSTTQLQENLAAWSVTLSIEEQRALDDGFAALPIDRRVDASVAERLRQKLRRLRERWARRRAGRRA